jgi:hypothetical protein
MTPLARIVGAILAACLLVAAFLFAWVAFAVLVALIVAIALIGWIMRALRGDKPGRGPVIIEGEFRRETTWRRDGAQPDRTDRPEQPDPPGKLDDRGERGGP